GPIGVRVGQLIECVDWISPILERLNVAIVKGVNRSAKGLATTFLHQKTCGIGRQLGARSISPVVIDDLARGGEREGMARQIRNAPAGENAQYKRPSEMLGSLFMWTHQRCLPTKAYASPRRAARRQRRASSAEAAGRDCA